MMVLIVTALLALGLTTLTYFIKRQALGFGATAFWILLALYSFTTSATTWDIYYGLGFFCIGMAIVMALETMMLREKRVVGGDEIDELDELIEERGRLEEAQTKIRLATGSPRRLKRARRAKKRASANNDEDDHPTPKQMLQAKYRRR